MKISKYHSKFICDWCSFHSDKDASFFFIMLPQLNISMLYTYRSKSLTDLSEGELTEISLNQSPSSYKASLQKNLEVQ